MSEGRGEEKLFSPFPLSRRRVTGEEGEKKLISGEEKIGVRKGGAKKAAGKKGRQEGRKELLLA